MDQTEWRKLFETNAELNSPEAQAARAELTTFLEEQKQSFDEPLEVNPYVPYTDSAEFSEKISRMETLLQQMQEAQETDRQAQIKSEKDSRAWDTRTFIVALLTLIATVLFGLKSL